VQKSKTINELMAGGGERLTSLKKQVGERSVVLGHVCTALPPKLAAQVASAGLDQGQLTIGVTGAAWASRLRYVTETLRKRVGKSLGVEIQTVRLKVVPPRG
jgi:hypothetical protein